jgi:opacity protein-like surface antigen
MTARFMTGASAAFLFGIAALDPGQAQAQNYDGNGLLRFGVFGQGSSRDFDVQGPALATGTLEPDGFGGGVSYGYDWVLRNSIVLGVEGDVSIEDDSSDTIAGRNFASDYVTTVRGRLGVYARPGWLFYATGGVAFEGVVFEGVRNPMTLQRTKVSHTLTGWTLGGGTELDWHHITLFAEFLFADLNMFDVSDRREDANLAIPGIQPTRYALDVDEHLVRLGVKFKIGHDFYEDDVRYGRLR